MAIKLTEQEYADLLTNERNLSAILTEFDKAEQCGLECSQLRAIAQQQLDLAQRLKKHYSPHQIAE